jgi:hypothetical protein
MTAGDSPVRRRTIMAVAYANFWDERLGLPADGWCLYLLRL